MRTRQTVTGSFSDKFIREQRSRSCSSGSNWSPWTTSVVTYGGSVTTKTITDVQTPGFQSLLECGKFLPLNPVTIITETEHRDCVDLPVNTTKVSSCTHVSHTYEGRGCATYLLWDRGWRLSVPDVPESAITAVTNGAVADARQNAWDALTFLREYGKTTELFRTNIGRVRGYAERSARFARRFKKDPLRAFSDKWLEYRYGWTPLVYDVVNAAEALSRDSLTLARGRSTHVIDISDSRTDFISPAANQSRNFTETIEGRHVVRGWAAADMTNPFLNNRIKVDPIITLWETLPFSVVVDMFIQVGTWLEAVSPNTGGRDLGSCASIRSSYVRKMTGDAIWHNGGGNVSSGGGPLGGWSLEVESYHRFASSPSLPGWNPRLSPTRVMDLIAMASGLGRVQSRSLRI